MALDFNRLKNQKVVNYRPFEHEDEAESISLSEVDVVVAYNRNDMHFEVDPNFDLSEYYLVRSGSVDIYYKNDAVSQVTEELKNELYVKPAIYGIGE